MKQDGFNALAKERYGDKITVTTARISAEAQELIKEKLHMEITPEEIEAYGEHAWVEGGKCPECGAELRWYFEWGFVHGVGACTKCKKTEFRYYHYIHEKGPPCHGYALIGMPE